MSLRSVKLLISHFKLNRRRRTLIIHYSLFIIHYSFEIIHSLHVFQHSLTGGFKGTAP
jgi:hypothetical protein